MTQLKGEIFYFVAHTGPFLWLCLSLMVYETFSIYYVPVDLLKNQEKIVC